MKLLRETDQYEVLQGGVTCCRRDTERHPRVSALGKLYPAVCRRTDRDRFLHLWRENHLDQAQGYESVCCGPLPFGLCQQG